MLFDLIFYGVIVFALIKIIFVILIPIKWLFRFFKKFFSLFKRTHKLDKGELGEYKTSVLLNKVKRKYKNVLIYSDVLIEKENGHSSQIDHILIVGDQVLVIETKNYSGIVIANSLGKDWQIAYKNGNINRSYNAFEQNEGHINFLKDSLLDSYRYDYYNFIALPEKKKKNYSVVGGVDEDLGIITNYRELKKIIKVMLANKNGEFETIDKNRLKKFENYSEASLMNHLNYVKKRQGLL